jgi:hypothetical protein
MAKPFCDRLTVSVPASHDAALKDVLSEYAIQLQAVPDSQPGYWRLPSGGSFFYRKRRSYASLEASARTLADLRAIGAFGEYLQALGALPWRVTRLDATLDIPRDAAPFLEALYQKAKAGGVSLGRKAVLGSEVVRITSSPLYGDRQGDTGTVYVPSKRFGAKRQYVTGYDKRQEVLSRGGADPGPLLRIEASAARQKGATLSDAWDPTALFYDIVSPDILAKPDGVPDWEPQPETWAGGGMPTAGPRARLDRYLSGSAGEALLAMASYPGGLSDIRHWLAQVERSRLLGEGSQAALLAEAPAAAISASRLH